MPNPFATESYDETPSATPPAVRWLIGLNVAVQFIQMTLWTKGMQRALGFEMRDFEQWWTILTYMFVHAGLLHLAGNMFLLWWAGRRVESEWGAAPFVRFYLWCGLGAWLFHLLFYKDSLLLGASGAVFGVMLAYALRWPDDETLFLMVVPMKVKHAVALYALSDLVLGAMSMRGMSASGIAHFAHLGGFAFAWVYLRWPVQGSLERLRGRVTSAPDEPDDPPRAVPRSAPRPRERLSEADEIVARSKALLPPPKRPAAPPAARAVPPAPAKPEEINRLLDKISEQGLESLTMEERRVLEEASKRLRAK